MLDDRFGSKTVAEIFGGRGRGLSTSSGARPRGPEEPVPAGWPEAGRRTLSLVQPPVS